jgi:hypothetical protein
MTTIRESSRLWWTVPAAVVIVLTLLGLVLGKPPAQPKEGTSYDASARGTRAAYLLLEELGYPVRRSRRPTDGCSVRWVLLPEEPGRESGRLVDWVRGGGVLVLADASGQFAQTLGIDLKVQSDAPNSSEAAEGPGVAQLAGGPVRVSWPGAAGEVWASAGGQPFVTIHRHGSGQVWLVNRPEVFTNRLIGEADNGILICRLAEATLARSPATNGTPCVAFDEFVHGMRDNPGVAELLLEPPTVWVTLHSLLLVGLLLWHHGPRFGGGQAAPQGTRHSAEEFLHALADLLQRKGDHAEAFRTARDELRHDLERELGLPHDAAPEMLAEAASHRGGDAFAVLRLLKASGPPAGAGAAAFVEALQQLEQCRNDFFSGRGR